MSKFIITKNIAKHGDNSIIVIPKVLRGELQPKTLVKLTIEVIRKPGEENNSVQSLQFGVRSPVNNKPQTVKEFILEGANEE
ncbi:hypothetical protein HZA97_01165 [Candidatus Woesearchaeota archaeon]|nr:hypothetical protein [Candidatus Woesearchaeota archaeon]